MPSFLWFIHALRIGSTGSTMCFIRIGTMCWNYVLVYLFMGICGWSVCFIISVGTVLWFICLCVKGISLQFIGHRCCIIDGDALGIKPNQHQVGLSKGLILTGSSCRCYSVVPTLLTLVTIIIIIRS